MMMVPGSRYDDDGDDDDCDCDDDEWDHMIKYAVIFIMYG